MNVLAHLTERSLGFPERKAELEPRTAVRVVVFDENRNIAMLHATRNGYHKLPGGGVEDGEDLMTALQRESREEIGCDIDVESEIGTIVEDRNLVGLLQTSHCFLGKVRGIKGTPDLTEDEIAEGFVTEWMPLEMAIDTLEREYGNEIGDEKRRYLARFMVTRDMTFLKKAREMLS
jgi:8-oxo-dGTP diphosphatase